MFLENDLQQAAYNSPSGKRQTFLCENVSRETDLKTATFTFPEMDGALVQSLGLGGRTFPLKCIFSGAKCKKEADSFEKLLEERGHGILEHPVYGRINVVPTGKIKRSDNLIDGINEATVETTFSETIVDDDDSVSEVVTADALENAMDVYEESAVSDFSDKIKTDSSENKMQLQSVLKKQTDSIFKGMKKLVSIGAKGKAEYAKWLKEAENFIVSTESNLDKIALYSSEIARTMVKVTKLPSKIEIKALEKISKYSSMINDITDSAKAEVFGTSAISNQYAATNLSLGSMVASLSYGLAVTAQNANSAISENGNYTGGFTSRSDILETLAQVTELFNKYSDYVDSQNKKNAFIDTGDNYEKVLNVVIISAKALEEAAFNLPVMRIIRLDRDRQLFELLTELYGTDGFDRQDQFINDNKLTADEIVLIPMGREIRYYV